MELQVGPGQLGQFVVLPLGQVVEGSSRACRGCPSTPWPAATPVVVARRLVADPWTRSGLCGTASGHRSVVALLIHPALSEDTCVIRALRCFPSRLKNPRSVLASRTGDARSNARRIVVDNDLQILVSALVVDLIDPDPPYVREPVGDGFDIDPNPGQDRPDRLPRDRIRYVIVVWERFVARHAIVASKAWVHPAPWRSHGVATSTPWSGSDTLGESASARPGIVPISSARLRCRPSPVS